MTDHDSWKPSAVAPQQGTVNIAEHLAETARRFPDKRAVVVPAGRDSTGRATYAHLTFKQLDEESDRCAHGLEKAGVVRGTRTILMVPPGAEFFVLTFALFKIGAVPVLIDPGMGRRQLLRSLAEVEAEAFIGVPRAHAVRIVCARTFRSVRVAVTVGRRWFWGGWRLADVRADPWRPYQAAPTRADERAAILFTSGSTGPAKGVSYEHGMFDAQVRYLQSHYGYGPEETDLATFPLFALFDAALGMTAVIPDMDPSRPAEVDPQKIIEAVCDHRVTHMFASPALLDRVSRDAEQRSVRLPSLKRVMTAGAPVPHTVLKRVRRLLPEEAEIYTPYGATESLPVASIESREILSETAGRTAEGDGICVGKPLSGMEVSIIEISDAPIAAWSEDLRLPTGQIGEICVKGPVVTKEYFRNPTATALAKIPAGDTLWHRMGDVGYLDEKGRLWFCGRKAHRVQTEQGVLFTIPCEAIFNQHPKVYRTALVGVGPAGRQKPVLCVEQEAGEKEQPTTELLEMARSNQLTRDIKTVLYYPSFPVDVRHNAKIFREKLALWATEQLK